MPKLSVCIICKNEEDKIEACLASVSWVDEIVILDSGSTDDTLTIAARFTDKIYIREDWSGFGIQHRRAEELASNDWVFSLDSDEIVSEELRLDIERQLQNATDKQVFVVNRLTTFCGKFVYHSGWYPDRIARIYNKTRYRFSKKLVHESLECKGAEKLRLKGNLLHDTFENLNSYLIKLTGYAQSWAEDNYQRGHKVSVLKAVSSSMFAFIRHYFFRLGFMDGRVGFLISVIQMQYTFNKYMILLLMNQTKAEFNKLKK